MFWTNPHDIVNGLERGHGKVWRSMATISRDQESLPRQPGFQASGMQSYTVFGAVDPIVAATAGRCTLYWMTSVISPAFPSSLWPIP